MLNKDEWMKTVAHILETECQGHGKFDPNSWTAAYEDGLSPREAVSQEIQSRQ